MPDPTAAVPLQARLDTAVRARLLLGPEATRQLMAARSGSAGLLQVIAIGDRIGAGTDTVDRAALTVPVAPGGTIDAGTVFEDPADPALRSTLPAYGLRYETVRFVQVAGEGFDLTAVLGPLPPADPAVRPYAVPFTATLSFRLQQDLQRSVAFTEYVPDGDGTRIRVASTQPGLRSEVYWALTHPESGAHITLSRAVTAAIPVQVRVAPPEPAPEPVPVFVPPILVPPPIVVVRPRPQPLEHPVVPPHRPVNPRVVMPLVGLASLRARDDGGGWAGDGMDDPVVRDHRTGGGPVIRDHRTPTGDGPVIRDHRTPTGDSPEQPPVLVTRYRVVTQAVEQSAHPDRAVLLFSPEVDRDVFVGVAGTGGPRVELVQRIVDGRTYLQQSPGSATFYHLPDELRLLRRVASPHTPVMSLSFGTGDDGELADIPVTVRFAVAGWTDPERLGRDRAALAGFVQPPADPTLQALELAPDRLGLELQLAGGGPIVGVRPQLSGLSLSQPVDCSVTLSPPAFQPAWAALGSGAGALVTGSLTVRLDAAGISARVPLTGRIDRALAPVPLLDVTAVAVRADGGVDARLVNATESPVLVAGLSAGLVVADRAVPAVFRVPPDGELAAGAGLDVVLDGDGPIGPGDPVSVALSGGGTTVRLDTDALYDAILDPTVQPAFERQVAVKVHGSVFDDPAILALSVDVEHGRGVNVERPAADAPRPTFVVAPQPATVTTPIKAFLLSADGELPTEVRYRVRAVRVGADDDWSPVVVADAVGDEILVSEYPPTG